jgi:cell division protein FtsL
MATAYQWMDGEEIPQRLKPTLVEGRLSRLKPRPIICESQLSVQSLRSAWHSQQRAAGDRKRVVVEWYTVKKIDNSRLVRNVEPVGLNNYYKTAALGAVIAFFCMFYVYQHFRCIDLSFQLEDLKAKQVQAQGLNSALRLEIATLRDPRRIDVIARHQLGLTQPTAMQVREYANLDGAEVAAVQYPRPNRAP